MTDRGAPIVTLTEHDHESGVLLTLAGRLDARSVADLRLTLHRVVADGTTPLLLDLEGVEIGDASGLGLVVELRRRAHRHGRAVHVVAADARTRRLLIRARMHGLLTAAAPRREPGDEGVLAGVS
ncbi:STAS domain-containing protein [Phycicoccus sonneratiae]|uniref:STAS domain-containing protein n=1 Tax=Phycicoccus sonneratiae TaxID=2807628 RepID=A0ABS2CLH3_9MICO|nr:STAS domain-containing protein [Phycicoccus sonneraticus]MBM6400630.1 STAS domain-containing protein [Phycicoccus sonneraticus]